MSAVNREGSVAVPVAAESLPSDGALAAAAGNTALAVPAPSAHTTHGACANCGATVTAKYCGECGQRVEHAMHSLWHFLSEATEDLTHADSRLWRTLVALLFKPGYLTCEFIAGRRASYLPPIRLYLVLSVLYFLIGSLTHQNTNFVLVAPTDELRKEVLSNPNVAKRDLQHMLAQSAEERRQRADKECERLTYDTLRNACHRAVADGGRELVESYRHTLPRAIFLMVPLLALVLKPLYLRSRRYYVEHALFVLHDHACLFLLFSLLSIAASLVRIDAIVTALTIAVWLYVPYYYYRAMRRVYGESAARTVGKLLVLSVAYLVTGLLALMGASIYSLLTQANA
jgi:hypothetical protein